MAYRQLKNPNINTGAALGYCLGYVDNALNATNRSDTAQIAYNTAITKGWVRNNTDFPKNVWFVMFWSLNNGSLAGYGHVALAYIDANGNMQIHDSEVHSGVYPNRPAYGSLSEIKNWFASGGISITYLGWSIGVDGVVLLEETSQNTNNKKGVATMYAIYWVPNPNGQTKDAYFYNGVSFEHIEHGNGIDILKQVYKDNNGKDIPEYNWTNEAPWYARLQQPSVNLQEMADKIKAIEKKVNTLK